MIVLNRYLHSVMIIGIITGGRQLLSQETGWRMVKDEKFRPNADIRRTADEVSRLLQGPDGLLYVVRPQEVDVLDRRGRLAKRIGRPGTGPGHFARIFHAGWLGDTLWTSDVVLRRITMFHKSGGLINTFELFSAASISGHVETAPRAMLVNGTALIQAAAPADLIANRVVTSVPLLRVQRRGFIIDTLYQLPVTHEVLAIDDTGSVVSVYLPQPLSITPIVAASPDGTYFVVVERDELGEGSRARVRVTRIRANGDTIYSRLHHMPASPVTAAFVNALIERLRNDLLVAGHPSNASVIRQSLFLPQFHPAVSQVLVGPDGRVWLRGEEVFRDSVRWTILGPAGEKRGVVMVPSAVRLHYVNGTNVWAVRTQSRGGAIEHYLLKASP